LGIEIVANKVNKMCCKTSIITPCRNYLTFYQCIYRQSIYFRENRGRII